MIGPQTITFGTLANQTYGNPPFTVSATASSGLTVSFASLTSSVCSVSGSIVTLLSAGTCTIQATQPGIVNIAPASPVNQSFTVNPAPQTITFSALSNQTFGAVPFTVSATASSGLAVSFNSQTAGVCSVSGSTVTLVSGGTCTIQATQTGNTGYGAATPVSQSFTVALEAQTISVGALAGLRFAGQTLTLQTAASSGLRVTANSTTPSVCSIVGGNVTALAAGTCTIHAVQAGNAAWQPAPAVNQSFAVARPAGAGVFTAALGSPFTTGANPNGVAVGDFNGDGKQDVAIADSGSGQMTVLLGNGSGSFTTAPGSPFALGSEPVAVAAGDFNGDGILDLAVTDLSYNLVSILPGNGDGTFSLAADVAYATGSQPYSIAVGDFNNDGALDLAISNEGSNNVTILLGNGAGGFAPAPGILLAAGSVPYTVVTADVNGDGNLDLIAANNYANNISVLLGDGTGGFTAAPGSPIATGTNPLGIVATDLNGDGRIDLAISNQGSNNVTVLLGSGTGTFVAASGSPFAVGASPGVMASGDFNGDGYPDLAVTNFSGNSVTLLLGSGTGTFISAASGPLATGSHPVAAVAADFNGDGMLDLLTTNFGSSNATVLLGRLSQTITFSTLASQTWGTAPFAVSATASSGLAVSFASTTASVCSISGSTVTILTPGTCTIQATQAGNATYIAATPVSQSFTVAKATPVLTWTAPAAITFGSALGNGQLNATASVPGTFVYTPAAGYVLPVGTGETLSVTFTPTDSADYNAVTATTTITVNAGSLTPASIAVTKTLTRVNGNIYAAVTIANNGGTAAANVVLTSVTVGGVKATPVPEFIGNISGVAYATWTVSVPGSVGASGTASSLVVSGTYTGGTFSSSGRITLP